MHEPPSRPTAAGRLAPSPTGGLHLGHARTFLAAWLAARRANGRVILRIEDLDATRARAGMDQAAIDDLRWLGLDWNEGPDLGGPNTPYVQSQRLDLYANALARLRDRGLVYPCTCTRADFERMASAPHAEDETPAIACPCRDRNSLTTPDRPFAWRFKVPDRELSWHDAIHGAMTLNPAQHGGDFIVARSSGEYAYQLAVVVDDAAMGITQVVRGDDLIPSTPRQLLLYEALDQPPPQFAHLPLVVDASGRRLAKRHEGYKLATLRAAGADPARLVGALAHSLGLATRPMPSPPQAWHPYFAFRRIPREPWHLPDWLPGEIGVANL